MHHYIRDTKPDLNVNDRLGYQTGNSFSPVTVILNNKATIPRVYFKMNCHHNIKYTIVSHFIQLYFKI